MKLHGIIIFLFFLSSFASIRANGQNSLEQQKRPNILLIVIDDLNDYVQGFGGHSQASTPNITKLAESGVSFQNAYSNSPICGPSRSSFLTGVYPHNSNNLFFDSWFKNPVLANTNSLSEHFKKNGYQVIGTGKIMHNLREDKWSEYENPVDYGPVVYNGKEGVAHPDVPEPYRSIGKIDGSFGPFVNLENRTIDGDTLMWVTGRVWKEGYTEFKYINDQNRDLTPDEKNAAWVEKRLTELANAEQDKPFFMAVGFLRPHTPLVAPQRFFDQFPIEGIQLSTIRKDDKKDTYFQSVRTDDPMKDNRGKVLHDQIGAAYGNQELGLKKFVQAYLACIAAVDENVGQVMQAIDNSPLKENTIVMLVSDHGFQMGEKEYLYKNSLWEESTRVPMIIRAPGITNPNSHVNHPVSLIDIYPTLVDLADLPKETKKNSQGRSLDGFSLKPFLENPKAGKWDGPEAALTTVYAGKDHHNDPAMQHYSVRTKDWRYIIYNTGKEELYHNSEDPYEWVNLLDGSEKFKAKKLELREILKNLTYPVVPNALKN
ncbi:MAG: sulfatase [Reichenbachiella sp.]